MAQIEGLYNQNNEQFAGISNLMSAVSNNDVEGTRFFAKAGSIIVNQKNKGGATALHIASREGNLDIVKILIDSGANPNLADNEGYTPLMRASLSASSEVVDYLLSNSARAGIFNSQNETAIIHATSSKCDECLNLLIEKGQMIKNVDTLILKGQIADAIVIANNQDNTKTQSLLYGFLDYVSKSAPLVVKSKPDVADEPLPFRSNIPKNMGKNSAISLKSPPAMPSVMERSISNIFEEEQNVTPLTIERDSVVEAPQYVKELPITKNDIAKNKKDEIIIPTKKFSLKKEVEQTPIPAVDEKITKISQIEAKVTPISVPLAKKFKFVKTNQEATPQVLDQKILTPADNKGETLQEPVITKKYKFKSSENTQIIDKISPKADDIKIENQPAIISESNSSALNNSNDNQQFEIKVSKSEVAETKPSKEVKKFIFKQQIDKAN